MKKNQFVALAMAAAVLAAGFPAPVRAGQTGGTGVSTGNTVETSVSTGNTAETGVSTEHTVETGVSTGNTAEVDVSTERTVETAGGSVQIAEASVSAAHSVKAEDITEMEKTKFLKTTYRVECDRLPEPEPKLYGIMEWECDNFILGTKDAQRDGETSKYWAFEVDLEGSNIFTEEQLERILKAFLADNPQHFWLSGEMIPISTPGEQDYGTKYSGFKACVFEQYASGKERDRKFCEIIANYEGLYASIIKENDTDFDIVKKLYAAMAENLTYSGESELRDTVAGCLQDGAASGAGMAKLFQLAMNRHNIDNRYLWADGSDKVWNCVKMPDGKYYGVDVLSEVQAAASGTGSGGYFLAGKTTALQGAGSTFLEEHPLSAEQAGSNAYPDLAGSAYNAPFQSVTMEKEEFTVKAGRRGKITLNQTDEEKKSTITYSLTPAAPSNLAGITYESSDPSVLKVNEETGSWDALHSGTAQVKVKVTDTAGRVYETSSCAVTVEGEIISADAITTEQLEDFLDRCSQIEYTQLGRSENGRVRQLVYNRLKEECRRFTLSRDDAMELATDVSLARSMEIRLDLGADSVTLNDIWTVVFAFISDNPQYFWMTKGAVPMFDENDPDKIIGFMPTIYPQYQRGEERYEKFRQIVARFHGAYTSKIGPNDTDYDIVKKLYSALIDDVDFVIDAPMTDSVAGCLDTREAVCEGMARTMCLGMNYYGIDCRYVDSHSHAWNYVKMPNGQFYGLDVTWGDNATDWIGEHLRYSFLLVGDLTPAPSQLGGKAFMLGHPLQEEKQQEKENGSLLYPVLAPYAYSTALNSVRMEKSNLSFYAGDEGRITYNRKGNAGEDVITYMFSPAAPTDITSVTYRSSNPSVLQVDAQTGEWKALKEGVATVTVEAVNTSADTFESEECTVTVGKGSDKPVPVIKTGDVNNDGKVDLLDLRLVLRYVCGKTTLEGDRFAAADVNKDGRADLLDLRLVLRFICGKISSL